MSTNVPFTVAYGDGIGPEIMEAPLHIIQKSGERIDLQVKAGYSLSQGQ